MQALWKAIPSYLKKLKEKLPYDPVIPLLGIYPKKTKTLIQKNICTPMFIAFRIAKIWRQPECSLVDEWVKKALIHSHNGIHSAIKKEEILPFVTARMDLESIMLNELSQSEKDKCHMISVICGI